MPSTSPDLVPSVCILLAFCVSGCVLGPRDGMFYVSGLLPGDADQSCLLQLAAPRSAKHSEWGEVQGQFRKRVMVHSAGPHKVLVVCEGKVVAERLVTYGKDVPLGGVVSLGAIAL